MLRIKSGFSGERSLVLPKMVTDMMAADAIVSVLYVTDIGYYPKAENHYRERHEPIDQYVFIYCIDGRGSYEVGGNSYEVSANQYLSCPQECPTDIRQTPKSRGLSTGSTSRACSPRIMPPTP